ncbi:lipid-a-disaccharide synthase [hydrocarbon metagenome]|uniref:lipid-A-disaccharide synthase n=1 Tax=hydrocarbon metagenome TaxID=938273 RepID=A0A0W8G184_9ZZZZ
MNKRIMIIAGEVSGDMHGSALIKSIRELEPNVNICGIGGNLMQAAGMDLIYHIKEMAFLGFVEIIKHLPFIKRVQKDLLKRIKNENIKEVVLIDYPGFNLNIAPKIKKLGVKVYYYISPQIWAWGQGRIKKIKKYIDKMIVLFPFEKEFYERFNVEVEYVGHPLIDRIQEYNFLTKEELFEKLNMQQSKEILLVMPGSRDQEVQRIFPEVIKAAKLIADKCNMNIVVACSENINEALLKDIAGNIDLTISHGNNYDLISHAKFGIIKSGTSTLESGLMQLPSIVVYKTAGLTYRIGKSLAKIKNIAMANIIIGETIFPELIQSDVNKEKIFSEADKILSDEGLYNSIKEKLSLIREKLGNPGASKRAAEIIVAGYNEN